MALRNLTVAIAFLSIIVTTTASGGTAYSLNANSVTTKPLPSDVLSHCYGNTSNCSAGDAVAKCTMTDCGNLSELNNPTYIGSFVKASPGRDDLQTQSIPQLPLIRGTRLQQPLRQARRQKHSTRQTPPLSRKVPSKNSQFGMKLQGGSWNSTTAASRLA